MDKYRNKYRIASARAEWWDYGWNGAYFVTVCTRNREHFFGKIIDGEIKYSPIGQNAHTCWQEIPNHLPFAALGEFVVMPDHVHGIIVVDNQTYRRD